MIDNAPPHLEALLETTVQLERFRDYLAGQGLRLTKQRQAIAEVFFASGAHLSLPEVLDLAREQPRVGRVRHGVPHDEDLG